MTLALVLVVLTAALLAPCTTLGGGNGMRRHLLQAGIPGAVPVPSPKLAPAATTAIKATVAAVPSLAPAVRPQAPPPVQPAVQPAPKPTTAAVPAVPAAAVKPATPPVTPPVAPKPAAAPVAKPAAALPLKPLVQAPRAVPAAVARPIVSKAAQGAAKPATKTAWLPTATATAAKPGAVTSSSASSISPGTGLVPSAATDRTRAAVFVSLGAPVFTALQSGDACKGATALLMATTANRTALAAAGAATVQAAAVSPQAAAAAIGAAAAQDANRTARVLTAAMAHAAATGQLPTLAAALSLSAGSSDPKPKCAITLASDPGPAPAVATPETTATAAAFADAAKLDANRAADTLAPAIVQAAASGQPGPLGAALPALFVNADQSRMVTVSDGLAETIVRLVGTNPQALVSVLAESLAAAGNQPVKDVFAWAVAKAFTRSRATNQTIAVNAAIGAAAKQAASINSEATAVELAALAAESERLIVTDAFADSQAQALLSSRLNPNSLLQPTGFAIAVARAIQVGGTPAATAYTAALAQAFGAMANATWILPGTELGEVLATTFCASGVANTTAEAFRPVLKQAIASNTTQGCAVLDAARSLVDARCGLAGPNAAAQAFDAQCAAEQPGASPAGQADVNSIQSDVWQVDPALTGPGCPAFVLHTPDTP